MGIRSLLPIGHVALATLAISLPGWGQDRAAPSDPGLGGDTSSIPPPVEAAPQVVVLHNGSVVQGRVERFRDRLTISNGPWYVVRIPVADVDFVAPDFAAAYRTKRARLDERDFARHLQLAQWCLRHQLDRFAAEQLLHLSRLDPLHASVQTLEQQLVRRANQGRTDAGEEPPAVPVAAASSSTTRDELADVPPVSAQALAEFTRSIQPLLLNRCGQTTCHGAAGESSFELQRLRASGVARKDLTLKNLRAVLAQIGPLDAEQSALTQQATRAHGAAAQAPFGPHEARQLRRLVEWATLVARGESVPPAEGVRLAAAEPFGSRSESAVSTAEGFEPLSHEPEVAESLADDPYDPAAFNARFSGDASVDADLPR